MKTLMDYITEAQSQIKQVSVDDAKSLVDSGVRILDVREPGEYLSGTITGAINVPRGTLEPAADLEYAGANPDLRDHRNDQWLIVCRSGGRAALATKILSEMGFTDVFNMIGGMIEWESKNFPTCIPSSDGMAVMLKEPCLV